MPVTFNSNNNYNVEIVTEPDVLNPTVMRYSSITNTPYIELKITSDIYQYPLIAGNMNFDGLYRFIDHHAQNNANNSCTPVITPHGVNTTNTFGATNFPGTLANGSVCALPQITANVTSSFQGPFQSHRSYGQILNDQVLNGVAWTKVIWVGVYEYDNGTLANTVFSPEISEDIATWQLWDPNNPAKPITNNIYPIYIRAFVFLEFAPAGPNGLTSDIDIFIDIDEDTPIYGCTNPSALNYNSTATIDDGSCSFTPTPKTIYIQESEIVHSAPFTGYTDPPFPSQVPSFDSAGGTGTMDLSGEPFMPKNLKASNNNQPLSTTYMPGDSVYETVLVNIAPRTKDNILYSFSGTTIETGIATFDFTIAGGPDNQDMTDPTSFLGDTANNLTAAGIYINNNDPDNGSVIGRGDYVANNTSGSFSSNTSVQPNWMPDSGFLDVDGLFPRTIVEWPNANEISFEQPDGSFFTAELDGIWAEEIYALNPLVPGQEWFPMRIELYVTVEFIMPNHDVYLNLDLIHDTQRLLQN